MRRTGVRRYGPVRRTGVRRYGVLGALMLGAFAFNTTENLPIGLLAPIAAGLRVSQPDVGLLVSGYGLTVMVFSLPVAYATRRVPRRYLLSVLLAVLVAASWLPALAGPVSYGTLLGARVATAVAQALFWAVMGPVAVGLFAPEQRGRVMGALSVGGSLAIVLGVPAGTWLGQRRAWEDPFLVLGGLGVVALAVVAVLLPVTRPEAGHAAYGVRPDRWWFALVLVVTGVSVTGVFAGFTYLAPYLGGLGYPAGAVGPLLFVFGAAGVVGVAVAGPLLDRWPRGTLVVPLGVQTVALLGLYGVSAAGVPGARALAAVMLAALGSAVGPVFMATQSLVLRHAPGRTELALAANSAAFNAGVALGASTGGLLLPLVGVDGAFLVGGVGTVVALGVLVLGDRYRPGWARPVAEVRDMEDGGQVSRF